MIYEVCTGSYVEAINASLKGADRIELCDNLKEGGTTPSYGTIKKLKEKIKTPFNVIIRPRGGNFIYSQEEKEIMLEDINICNDLGVNGIVIGALNADNSMDINFIKEIVRINKTKEITFHMAFDEVNNKKEAIDILVRLNIKRILTKGGNLSALNNLDYLKQLIDYSKERIIIMPGGGITKENRIYVEEKVGALELHGTKII